MKRGYIIIIVFFIILFFVLFSYKKLVNDELKESGVQINAKVVNVYTPKHKRSSDRSTVWLEYYVDGKRFLKSNRIIEKDVSVGDCYSLTYSSESPSLSRVNGKIKCDKK